MTTEKENAEYVIIFKDTQYEPVLCRGWSDVSAWVAFLYRHGMEYKKHYKILHFVKKTRGA